jgi:hypothetical protein
VSVELDTRELEAGVSQLVAGIRRKVTPAAAGTANTVAGRLRSALPRRTGRLQSSVSVTALHDGAEVHYGAGVPYASYIDGRTGATDSALLGCQATFLGVMRTVAASEVRRL